MNMNIITADKASQIVSKCSSHKDLILNDIYSKIRKAATEKNPKLSLSYMIARGDMGMMKKEIKPILKANGYSISIIKYKKIIPIMDNVGRLRVEW